MLLALVTTKSILAILLILLFCAIIWFFSPARRERLECREIERRRDDSNFLQELCSRRAYLTCTEAQTGQYHTLEYDGSILLVRRRTILHGRGTQMELVAEIEINTLRDTATCWQGWIGVPDEPEIDLGDLGAELELIFDGKPVYRHDRRKELTLN